MGRLQDRVVVITGAGRGLGREHALLMASEGAKVVVNDLGGAQDGSGGAIGPAQEVVDEITAMGGTAIANGDSVATWDGSKAMIDAAIDAFGDLHGIVNNAGILRDRMLVSMSEDTIPVSQLNIPIKDADYSSEIDRLAKTKEVQQFLNK